MPSTLAVFLHDRRGKQARFHVIHTHTIHSWAFHALEAPLDRLESGLVPTCAGFEVLHPLLDVVQSLLDAHKPLRHVVVQAVQLVGEGANGRREGRIFLAGCSGWYSRLMIVSALLDGEAPLISELNFADSLRAKRAVDLTSGGIALLGGAVVLDAAAIADEIVASRLSVAIVGRAQLDYAVALVFGDALD